MEILPHFWIGYFKTDIKEYIYKKNIKYVINLSKSEDFIKNKDLEEIRVPIDYNNNNNVEEINNILYQHLFDITEYIHDKVINCHNILLIGYETRQDIDAISVAYFIRYGKINTEDAIKFLKSKKRDIFNPNCIFYYALNKFNNEYRKIY